LRDIQHSGRVDGLTSDKIYFLGEDTRDRLYVGLGVGIDVIDDSTIDHFSSANGMMGDDCAGRAVLADPDGAMWFGTTRGMSRFNGAAYRHDDIPPAPILMNVARDASAVTVHFATPTYAHRNRLEQQVRLAPLESTWRPTTTNELRFAHLDPGHYVFEVRARFGHGSFGPTTAFAFGVPTKWWQTWWLRSVAALLALGGIGLVLGWRNRVTTGREAARIRGQSEARFRALIEQNPDAVIVHRDNVLLYVNPKAVEMLGYASATELVGQPLSDIIVPDERSEIRSRVAKVLETGRRAAPRDTVLITASGKELMVEVTALRVDFDGGPAVLALGRDVTERKELEARVMLSDRMASIGTLAAGIAHEINNPLAYIQGNLDLIREQIEKPALDTDLLRECLNDALEGAHRVGAIVKGVKMFSRLEDEDFTPIDIPRALESALRMASSELRQCCEVTKDLGEVTTVIGNEARLCQVFINLLVNAAHAMPKDRSATDNRIRISTRMRDGHVIITVDDNGVGMPPEVSRRVFEPFFTTKEIGKGTGLGLSLCHGNIKALRGTIDFTSHVGQGTSFQIVLPAAPPPAGDRPPDATADAAGTSAMPGVLVIDDDDRLLRSFERTLQRHYRVTAVPSAQAALEILQRDPAFDIILCDLMMPEMTGMELHAKLLQTSPSVAARMVFMTGGAFTPEARVFVESPSIRHVTKPFTYADLKVVLEGKIAAA
jgi:PAS domain S-box-containing protein